MADKVKENELRLLWFSVPLRNIEQERHTNIPQCMPCYSYAYIKKNCPKIPKSAVNVLSLDTHLKNASTYKIPNALTVEKRTEHSQANVNKEKEAYKK